MSFHSSSQRSRVTHPARGRPFGMSPIGGSAIPVASSMSSRALDVSFLSLRDASPRLSGEPGRRLSGGPTSAHSLGTSSSSVGASRHVLLAAAPRREREGMGKVRVCAERLKLTACHTRRWAPAVACAPRGRGSSAAVRSYSRFLMLWIGRVMRCGRLRTESRLTLLAFVEAGNEGRQGGSERGR